MYWLKRNLQDEKKLQRENLEWSNRDQTSKKTTKINDKISIIMYTIG